MPATIVRLEANPGPAEVRLNRLILLRAGVDPDNRNQILHLTTYGVSPLYVVTAAAQLAITFDCPMECGRKLDPSDKDAMGVDLCPQCFYEAGLENEHSDGYHAADQDGPHPHCPFCKEAE